MPSTLPPTMTVPAAPLPAIVRFDPPASEPVLDRPRPDRLQQGDPLRRTWSLYEAPQGDLSAGIWACEVGRWRIAFPPGKDEYFHVLEGRVRLHDTQGAWTEFGPGEGGVIPGGFEGAFEVVETVRKHFVVIDRGAS